MRMAIASAVCSLLVKDLRQRASISHELRAPQDLILHVDDEPLVRKSMLILLSADGYEVSSAASGTEALKLASGAFIPMSSLWTSILANK
jgi:response regulator RpfG family c-di-GMP phosphodiesterase